MARTRVSTTKKAKKQAVAKDEEEQVKVDKKSRRKFSKQLRTHQESLQSISKKFKAEEFLDSNPEDIEEDENFVRCPRCCYKMNESQVTEGFANNVLNHKTTCPDCDHKFSTIARIRKQYYVWLCKRQTKDQFEFWKSEREFAENEDIVCRLATDRPEIVFNAYKYSDKDNFKTVKDAVENWLEI